MHALVVPMPLGDASVRECADLAEESAAAHGIFVSSHAMSDGGAGLIDALMAHETVELHGFEVTDSSGAPIFASAARTRGTWWLEAAELFGVQPTDVRAPPLARTSTGLGELIAKCALRHPGPMAIGLAPAPMMDGGLGMLRALGLTVSDNLGRMLPAGQRPDLDRIRRVHGSPPPMLGLMRVFTGAQHPLEHAAIGLNLCRTERLRAIDALRRWADTLNDWRTAQGYRAIEPRLPSGGLAGGTGFALAALGADIRDGSQYFATLTRLEAAMNEADIAIFVDDPKGPAPMPPSVRAILSRTAKAANVPLYGLVHRPPPDYGLAQSRLVPLDGPSGQDVAKAVAILGRRLANAPDSGTR